MANVTTENKKLDERIRTQVIDVMREVLSDPDTGLDITPEFSRKLKQSVKAEAEGKLCGYDPATGEASIRD